MHNVRACLFVYIHYICIRAKHACRIQSHHQSMLIRTNPQKRYQCICAHTSTHEHAGTHAHIEKHKKSE